MKKRQIIFIIALSYFVGLPELLYTQNANEQNIDSGKPVTQLQDGISEEIFRISQLLTQNKVGEKEKARAIYTWVATNIQYDFLGVDNVTMGFDSREVVEEALQKRKGICQHYAELFHALAAESGLQSLVVLGYTKQNGKIANQPHAWNAVKIDSRWYLFDPTWAVGQYRDSKPNSKITYSWFMVQPNTMIKSHMPFDPLFQFREYVINHDEFKRGKYSDTGKAFDLQAQLERYLILDEEHQLPEAMERVKNLGISNSMVRGYYSNLNRRNKVYIANRQIDLHNQAIILFNEVVDDFNNYIDEMNSRGGRFPDNTQETEEQLIDIEKKALEVRSLLDSINPPTQLAQIHSDNRERLQMLISQIKKEQEKLGEFQEAEK